MKNVEILMIPVKDRQKSKEFYLKLGFEVVVEAPGLHGEMDSTSATRWWDNYFPGFF